MPPSCVIIIYHPVTLLLFYLGTIRGETKGRLDERVTSLDGPWMLQSGTLPVPTRARVRAEGGMRPATLLSARSTPNVTEPGSVLISEIVPNPASFGTFLFPLPPARAGALSSFSTLAAYRRPLAELGRLPLYSGHCTACASGVAGLAEMAEIGPSMV